MSRGWRSRGPASDLETVWAARKSHVEEGMEEAGAGKMVV